MPISLQSSTRRDAPDAVPLAGIKAEAPSECLLQLASKRRLCSCARSPAALQRAATSRRAVAAQQTGGVTQSRSTLATACLAKQTSNGVPRRCMAMHTRGDDRRRVQHQRVLHDFQNSNLHACSACRSNCAVTKVTCAAIHCLITSATRLSRSSIASAVVGFAALSKLYKSAQKSPTSGSSSTARRNQLRAFSVCQGTKQ